MKYAVFEFAGVQSKVAEGEEILIPGTLGKAGEKVKFEKVLLLADGEKITLGNPHIAGASLQGLVVGETRGEKIAVVKFRAKSRYRRARGHRSVYTRVKIEKILENK